MVQASALISYPAGTRELPRPGDYLCSDRALYRVERVVGDRALIEDCKTEALLDVSIAELLALRSVHPEPDHD